MPIVYDAGPTKNQHLPCGLECQGHHFVRYCLIGQIKNQVKFMNTSTEHILQCNQSELLADASGRIVDLLNENGYEQMNV